MKPGCRTAACLGALAIVTFASTAGAAAYPAELDAAADCTLWKGTVSGNDATVRMMFRLCPGGGDAVAGTGQWSSTVSGYNVRRLSGRWLDNGTRLELHDEAVIEQHAEPGWRFCAIDRYDLVRHGDELSGTYDSTACKDHATVKVTLIGPDVPAGATGSPPSPPPSTPTAPATSASAPGDPAPSDARPARSSKTCGCSVPGGRRTPSGALVALAIASALVLRRRRGSRVSRSLRPR